MAAGMGAGVGSIFRAPLAGALFAAEILYSDADLEPLLQALADFPTNGLIRNFTVVVSNVAEGPTPAKQLKVLKPAAPFRVVSRDGSTLVDPRSFDRYNTIEPNTSIGYDRELDAGRYFVTDSGITVLAKGAYTPEFSRYQ